MLSPRRSAALAAGAALLGLLPPSGAVAQTAPAPRDSVRPGRRPATPRDSAARLAGVTVVGSATGRGQARAAAAVDSTRLRAAVPGTSALKVIEQLPGVNVQGADGFGMYEWANRVSIRGFQSAQIGQTMDGVPLGDMSYGNFNGLGVGRAVDPSNLAGTSVAQGTGALGTASGNNLGGVVQYETADPAARRRLLVQQMVGQYNARRTTLRFDTGLGASADGERGFASYVSYSRFDTDKWKSGGRRFSSFPGQRSLLFGQGGFLGRAGEQWQDQLNAKAQLLLGPHRLTGFYDYAGRKEADYMDLSLGIFRGQLRAPGLGFGPDFDYLGSWAQSKQLAALSQGAYDPLTDASYYWSAQGARQDHLAYVRGEFALPRGARLDVQPYLHVNRGGGDWHAPSYGAAWAPDPIHFRQTQYRGDRGGATARLTAGFAPGGVANRLEVGAWVEGNTTRIRRPRWRSPTTTRGRPWTTRARSASTSTARATSARRWSTPRTPRGCCATGSRSPTAPSTSASTPTSAATATRPRAASPRRCSPTPGARRSRCRPRAGCCRRRAPCSGRRAPRRCSPRSPGT